MDTPGSDDLTPPPPPPPGPPHQPTPNPPPDPYRHGTGETVEAPRFGDTGSGQYAPDYGADHDPTRQPPAPSPGSQPSPSEVPGAVSPAPTRSRGSRKGMIAPIAAAVVLIGGIGLLIATSGSDEPEAITTPRIAEVNDPDEPLVESTVPGGVTDETAGDTAPDATVPVETDNGASLPVQTSPPLVEPTTIPDTQAPTTAAPETTPPGDGGPTQADLEAALLTADDLASDDWFVQEPEFLEFCDTVPDVAQPVARADTLFGALVLEPAGARQISNTLITFETAELAEQAFTSDVDEIVACDSTTTDLDGDQYRVQVNSDAFTAEQSASFPCADQSSFLVIQLTNENLSLPYVAQSTISFRCGRNVTITSLSTTIDLEDLTNDDFFNAAAISNTSTGALPGS